ncbi:hypothetical protein [Streptomyces sp. NPDC096033]|uniref:hypothetical protein n=1 Tax=Streptomyces sp. NPDC096033 TaxID=3366071 RepID=UPI003807BC07
MSSPSGLPQPCRTVLDRLRVKRDINTVTLRYTDAGVLVPEVEANLTHDELLAALPAAEARLAVHELHFAEHDGSRRSERILILWLPPDAAGQEAAYTTAYTTLKTHLPDIHVHLTARNIGQLDYQRLVALAS